jgi:hypothetical protein
MLQGHAGGYHNQHQAPYHPPYQH